MFIQNLSKALAEKTLVEITDFINRFNPDSTLRPLKCSKDKAIEKAVEQAMIVRKNRNRKKFKKLSRRLMVYC